MQFSSTQSMQFNWKNQQKKTFYSFQLVLKAALLDASIWWLAECDSSINLDK